MVYHILFNEPLNMFCDTDLNQAQLTWVLDQDDKRKRLKGHLRGPFVRKKCKSVTTTTWYVKTLSKVGNILGGMRWNSTLYDVYIRGHIHSCLLYLWRCIIATCHCTFIQTIQSVSPMSSLSPFDTKSVSTPILIFTWYTPHRYSRASLLLSLHTKRTLRSLSTNTRQCVYMTAQLLALDCWYCAIATEGMSRPLWDILLLALEDFLFMFLLVLLMQASVATWKMSLMLFSDCRDEHSR